MIIDAHHHLWQIGQNDQTWPTRDLDNIYRDFLPSDLTVATEDTGVTGTVLVQSQPSDADTLWLLSIAETTPLIQGMVGWTDLAAPQAATYIAYLASQPKLKGLRPMLQGLAEDDWILRPELAPALEAMAAHGLCFDALVYTRHLPSIDILARRYPTLQIIIDHGAKPPIATLASHPEQTYAWCEQIAQVAQNDNVACKLSGLLTEMAADQPIDDLDLYADHLLDHFGPQRLMWGSDWPVVLLKDRYPAWLDWTSAWLQAMPDSVKTAVLGFTAQSIYNLP